LGAGAGALILGAGALTSETLLFFRKRQSACPFVMKLFWLPFVIVKELVPTT
jgi:hypothetical protein